MVRDFLAADGSEPDEASVGQLVGLLGAAFCAAQLITAYPLGILSDRVGRRPIIVLGNLSCVVSVLGFGMSGSFFQAAASRFVGGALNGVIGAEKAVIGESLLREEQAKAMGWVSLAWGVGSLIGPMLGGVLARPCVEGGVLASSEHFCAAGGLMTRRPYLLPCLGAALFSAVATVLTAVALKESLPQRAPHGGTAVLYRPVLQLDADEGAAGRPRQPGGGGALLVEDSAELHRSEGFVTKGALRVQAPDPPEPWHQQRNVRLCLVGYALVAFCFILLDELTPIFASAPVAQGGLGWSTASLAAPLSFGGAVLIVWALWGFPWLHRRLGGVGTCRHGLWQSAPMALIIPGASLAVLPAQPTMWLAMALKSIAGVNAFTACIILVNAVSPVADLGAVNGVGQMLSSAARALGPALGGVSWAASLRLFAALGLPPAGHQFLPFAFAAGVAAGTTLIYRRVELPSAGPQAVEV